MTLYNGLDEVVAVFDVCPECNGRGYTMVETGVTSPCGSIKETLPEPCGCPAGERLHHDVLAGSREPQTPPDAGMSPEPVPYDAWLAGQGIDPETGEC